MGLGDAEVGEEERDRFATHRAAAVGERALEDRLVRAGVEHDAPDRGPGVDVDRRRLIVQAQGEGRRVGRRAEPVGDDRLGQTVLEVEVDDRVGEEVEAEQPSDVRVLVELERQRDDARHQVAHPQLGRVHPELARQHVGGQLADEQQKDPGVDELDADLFDR